MGTDQLLLGLEEQINQIRDRETVLGLCTTSTAGGKELNYFSFPKHHPSGFSYLHLVLQDTDTALQIIEDKRFSKASLFIDVEKKNAAFSAVDIIQKLGSREFHPIEPNALTVNALIHHIFEIGVNSNVLVVGSGLIAQAICQRLVICHENFFWIAAEGRKGTQKMNHLFPSKRADNQMAGQFDIVINCIPVTGVVDFNAWVKPDGLLIEASGASLPELSSLKCSKLRLDVTTEQLAYVAETRLRKTNKTVFGRAKVSDLHVCSGGFIGEAGDIVVDDFRNPAFVIGVADGMGGFSKRHAISFTDFISALNR